MVELVGDEYDTRQTGTRFNPFFSSLDRGPSCSTRRTQTFACTGRPRGRRVGSARSGRQPDDESSRTGRELEARFGRYPSERFTYMSPWPSAELTAEMGAALVRGLGVRLDAARWLLTERLTDWDLAIVVAGEPHTAAEAFWHGVDPTHPLHSHPSAAPAARSLGDVYRETDRLVGELVAAAAPRSLLVFSMGGMGSNNSDTPSMVLLPELVYRWATGNTLLDVPGEWAANPEGVPIIPEGQTWKSVLSPCYPATRCLQRD